MVNYRLDISKAVDGEHNAVICNPKGSYIVSVSDVDGLIQAMRITDHLAILEIRAIYADLFDSLSSKGNA